MIAICSKTRDSAVYVKFCVSNMEQQLYEFLLPPLQSDIKILHVPW